MSSLLISYNLLLTIRFHNCYRKRKKKQKVSNNERIHVSTGYLSSAGLKQKEPERGLFLAVPLDVYESFFRRPFVQSVLSEYAVTLLTFDPEKEEIRSWIQ